MSYKFLIGVKYYQDNYLSIHVDCKGAFKL